MSGTRLVVSDAHVGLKKAIATVFTGAGWQRCRVHFMRNVIAQVPKVHPPTVSSVTRTALNQPDQREASRQWREVVDKRRGRFLKAAACLDNAEEDVPASMAFPQGLFPRSIGPGDHGGCQRRGGQTDFPQHGVNGDEGRGGNVAFTLLDRTLPENDTVANEARQSPS